MAGYLIHNRIFISFMELTNQLLFFFSGLGVFNGLLMALYFLFVNKPRLLRNRMFGMLLLMLSIRIGKSIFYYFLKGLSKDVLQVGLTACLFIGVFLYIYISTSLERRNTLVKQEKWQLLGLGILAVGLGLTWPYRYYPEIWNGYFVKGIYAIWVIYIILSGIRLKDVFQQAIKDFYQIPVLEKWLVVVFFLNALICLVFNSVMYFGFPSYILGPLTFSFMFYFLALFLLLHPQRKIILQGEVPRQRNKKITSNQAIEIDKGLNELMKQKAWYKNRDLKLPQVAKELQITPHLLSQYMNNNLGKNFNHFINEYRINAACELLRSEHQFTLEGIGYEVGFRSKSNFFATFKKLKGCTPNQYVKAPKLH